MLKVTIVQDDKGKFSVGPEEDDMGGMGGKMDGMDMAVEMGGDMMEEKMEPEMQPAKNLDDALQIARQLFTQSSDGGIGAMRQEESNKVFGNNPKPAGYQGY